MNNVNQSTLSPKVFPLQPSTSSAASVRKATWHQTAVAIAAWVEIIVGASFVLVPNGQSQLVFGAGLEGAGVHFARLAGIGLIGLGLATLPSSLGGTRQSAVRTLLIFNVAATILFAWIGVATTFRGVVLWPVVILHAVLAIVLAVAANMETVKTVSQRRRYMM